MTSRKLELKCPTCGSPEVVYSCEPKCCFNHVCSECTGTFEPVTVVAGRFVGAFDPPDPLPDAGDPAVACARCESVAVYMLEDGGLACFDCRASLILELTGIAAP